MDPNDSMADIFALRLHLLDEEHRRAQSPSARRRVEAKMREVEAEKKKFEEASKVIDIAIKRWERDYDKMMEELAIEAGISVEELKRVKAEIARIRAKSPRKR